MDVYGYSKGLYKCSADVFYRKIYNLKEMIKIYENTSCNEIDKAYQLFKIYNTVLEFEQKYRLLLIHGSSNPVLKDICSYIPLISKKMNEYKELGYEKDFMAIRTLERKMDGYEEAKNVLFSYIESSETNEKHFCEDMGITSLEFDKYIRKVKLIAPNLYNQYLAKKDSNVRLKYNNMICSFMNIANAIETGYFNDGTEFSLLEFWARVPLKENFKDEYKDCQKINSNLEDCAANFRSRVISFIRATLPIKQHNIILNYMVENKLKTTSNTMSFCDFKLRYSSINKITIMDKDANGKVINFNFTEEDFNNIMKYIMLRRLPLILEIYEIVQLEYIKGNITVDTIKNMEIKNNRKIKK